MKNLCGIDEAGRGPLAGPLVMAGVVLYEPIDGLTDSKQLTEKRREQLYETITKDAAYHIVIFDAAVIDEQGISACLICGLKEIMLTLSADGYLFDGNTTFGIQGLRSQIKADVDIAEVSAASILAKVTRDRIMIEMGKNYPEYGFEKHKGYGTKAHIEAIRKNGYSPIHRKSFRIKSLEQPSLF
ncbi:ribonuclease HII [Hydrogenimonas cancrithermarum]|uniref:Ribonuclease HII n=1 Tax=Hydrogenimonas cancrithermarum TaxID=2993563 RepID=A0ABM8FLG4_9BACT|nr:ribonuclease HII [Hydrogenimonas cancrithermarum]BDY13200.1 ribonuclease HII [Hydrogenimonas cancrithermarum]